MSGAAGHVEPPKLTSIGRRGSELQGTWQRVNARPAPCFDLKLVCGGTQSAGYRHRRKEARSGAEGYVSASELTSVRRRGPRPWDTSWLRSPPLQGGVV
jgi:hypothetical protein